MGGEHTWLHERTQRACEFPEDCTSQLTGICGRIYTKRETHERVCACVTTSVRLYMLSQNFQLISSIPAKTFLKTSFFDLGFFFFDFSVLLCENCVWPRNTMARLIRNNARPACACPRGTPLTVPVRRDCRAVGPAASAAIIALCVGPALCVPRSISACARNARLSGSLSNAYSPPASVWAGTSERFLATSARALENTTHPQKASADRGP